MKFSNGIRELILSVLTLVGSTLYAQVSWPICFESLLNENGRCLIEDTGSQRYLVFGYQYDSFIGYSTLKGMVLSIDYNNDTSSFFYQLNNPDTTISFEKAISDHQGGFYVFGYAYSAPGYYGDCNLLFAHFDSGLVMTTYRILKPEWLPIYSIFSIDVLECAGGFYLGGQYRYVPSNLFKVFMMKINTDGVVLRSQDFPEGTTPSSSFDRLSYSADSSAIWMIGRGYENQSKLARTILDTNFNIINEKDFSYHPSFLTFVMQPAQIHWLNDTTFLMAALYTWNRPGQPQDDDIGFTILDTTLSYQPVALYGAVDTSDYPAFIDAFVYRNQDTIVFAGTHNLVVSFWPHRYSWLIFGQLDSSLDARYIYYYGGDASYEVMQIIPTTDGGVLIYAHKYDYLTMDSQWDVVVWKFDKDGILVGMESDPVDSGSGKLALIYPNPGTDQLTIECGAPSATLMMSDMMGNRTVTQYLNRGVNTINIKGLTSGTYLYRIVFSNQETMNGTWIKIN